MDDIFGELLLRHLVILAVHVRLGASVLCARDLAILLYDRRRFGRRRSLGYLGHLGGLACFRGRAFHHLVGGKAV